LLEEKKGGGGEEESKVHNSAHIEAEESEGRSVDWIINNLQFSAPFILKNISL
jgi:hypothetical protein